MVFARPPAPSPPAPSGRRARRWRARSRHRAVSEVVATILLLALTVTLFGAIFAFVSRFPTPPAQNVNQFQASVTQTSQGITSLRILQSGGPTVPSGASVILQASKSVPNWQFARGTGIPVAWGMGNSTAGWSTGQYWTTTFSPALTIPTNVTVYILSSGALLYAAVVPGYGTNLAPVLGTAYTTPASPTIGQSFWIFAPVTGNTTGLVVNVSLTGVPGLGSICTGPCAMTKNSSSLWSYEVASGETTTAGTYYAFIQGASSTTGGTIAGSVTVSIPTGSGGGGSSSLSIQPGMSPQPPTVPQQTTLAYFWATITYGGSKTNVPVSVNFTVSQSVGGRSSALTVVSTIPGQTGLTISGPSSLTIYSQTSYNFNSWLLNSSVTITATATLGQGVGSATGTIAFGTANYVQGIVYVTTSSTGATSGNEHSFSHTCTTTTCPYIFATVWDNFTTALGGPASVTVSGLAYANSTAHDYEIPAAGFATQTIDEGASLAFNLYGGTTRESSITTAGTYVLAIWLTVKSTGTGTPTIGYIYDTFSITVS